MKVFLLEFLFLLCTDKSNDLFASLLIVNISLEIKVVPAELVGMSILAQTLELV